MDVLRYIFYLGIVFIIFDLIWTVFLFLLNAATGSKETNPVADNILKVVSYYLLASLSALKTLEYMEKGEGFYAYIYGFIGAAVLYFYITGKIRKKAFRLQINQTQVDLQTFRKVRYESFYLAATVGFYTACLYYTEIASNSVTEWIYLAIGRIYDWPVIGWLIGFAGVFFLIRMITKGFNITTLLFTHISDMLTGKPKEDKTYSKYEIKDAEIVEETDPDNSRRLDS